MELHEIGNFFRIMRVKNGIKVDEMGELMKVTRNTISNFENGVSNNLRLFLKYCVLFGVDLKDIEKGVIK